MPVALATVIAIAIAVPSPASAAKGWKLPKVSSNVGGLELSSSATRCSKNTLGVWRFRAKMTGDGKVANLRWRVRISKNGAAHRLVGVRVSGSAPKDAKKAIADSLRSQSVRYVPGSRPRIESVAADGRVLSRRPFKPTRWRC